MLRSDTLGDFVYVPAAREAVNLKQLAAAAITGSDFEDAIRLLQGR